MTGFFKNLFLYSAGHTYSNLSRLFLRLFTGIMFLQLCVRQMLNFDAILGFLTRLAVLFPLCLMLFAENLVMSSPNTATDQFFNFQPGYPLMFIGIFIYILLAGPGKISLDYIIAAHFTENVDDEHVIDNA